MAETGNNNQAKALVVLDHIYNLARDGKKPFFKSSAQIVENFSKKYKLQENFDDKTKEKIIRALIRHAVMECGTVGFVTGFGGLTTLPITIPTNLGLTLAIQVRMIQAIAILCGYDIDNDNIRYAIKGCLLGINDPAFAEFVKQILVKAGVKGVEEGVKKMSLKVITRLNQLLGETFFKKFMRKSLSGKLVPIVGGLISGGVDGVETNLAGNRAYQCFYKGSFHINENDETVYDGEIIEE